WIEAGGEQRQINAGQALWTRPKSELSDEQYADAFRQFGGFGDPFATLHYRAEGVISFTALLFAPSRPGIDLFDPDRRNQLRLHVKQVFITDDRQDLVPAWLRFMVGVVDSEDLPLNVSRETPQATPVVARMRKTLTGRILDLLKTKAKDDAEGFDAFWTAFGPVLKEGLYEDADRRDALFGLCRFHSTKADGRTDLAGYVERMKDGQDAIYYLVGDGEPASLAAAPQLEGFRAKGVEVLLLTDPIDAFWTAAVGEALGKPLKSVAQAGDALDAVADDADQTETADKTDDAPAPGVDALTAALKIALRDEVADIRASRRLTESPVCLVAAEGGLDIGAERILRRGRGGFPDAGPRVLELNPSHPMVKALAAKLAADGDAFDVAAAGRLLVDQARILDGDAPSDPQAFSRRLEAALCAAWSA
ncbi:MAG: molecular chaperone HtpG, partial [Pseudomonadota bacterium]